MPALTNQHIVRQAIVPVLQMQCLHPTHLSALLTRNAGTVRLAVVGDVHGKWHAADVVALQHLEADCALFVGDIGEEDLELVGAIADMDHPKAVILGNHDAWYDHLTMPQIRMVYPALDPLCSKADGGQRDVAEGKHDAPNFRNYPQECFPDTMVVSGRSNNPVLVQLSKTRKQGPQGRA